MGDLRERFREARAPGEVEAGARVGPILARAFAAREPIPRRRQRSRVVAIALACTLVAAAVAATATSAGRGLVSDLRGVVAVERTQPALRALPSEGRVLVSGPGGSWVVAADGARRRLGGYASASWSSFGRFVVAAQGGELLALEPNGKVRWALARPGPVRFPRWGGSQTDTRIAYLAAAVLRVVAGDGTADRPLTADTSPVAPAWQPGDRHVLAYVDHTGGVVVRDVDSGSRLWRARPVADARGLSWSDDGRLLLVRGKTDLAVLDANGRLRFDLPGREATPIVDAAFSGNVVVYVQHSGAKTTVWAVARPALDGSAAHLLFQAPGALSSVTPSPDGRWLLLSWPEADQWLFLRTTGRPRIETASGIASQFGAGSFPDVAGWAGS